MRRAVRIAYSARTHSPATVSVDIDSSAPRLAWLRRLLCCLVRSCRVLARRISKMLWFNEKGRNRFHAENSTCSQDLPNRPGQLIHSRDAAHGLTRSCGVGARLRRGAPTDKFRSNRLSQILQRRLSLQFYTSLSGCSDERKTELSSGSLQWELANSCDVA
ncbi:MAG: hypothetical protein QOJ04_1211, partial [Caballeronia sp.]|nr:hypothetical protein [Caballeronia sp.]